MINDEKLAEFGVHCDQYYQLPIQVIKTQTDEVVLDRLWNEYWVQSLATSPLLHNGQQI